MSLSIPSTSPHYLCIYLHVVFLFAGKIGACVYVCVWEREGNVENRGVGEREKEFLILFISDWLISGEIESKLIN